MFKCRCWCEASASYSDNGVSGKGASVPCDWHQPRWSCRAAGQHVPPQTPRGRGSSGGSFWTQVREWLSLQRGSRLSYCPTSNVQCYYLKQCGQNLWHKEAACSCLPLSLSCERNYHNRLGSRQHKNPKRILLLNVSQH